MPGHFTSAMELVPVAGGRLKKRRLLQGFVALSSSSTQSAAMQDDQSDTDDLPLSMLIQNAALLHSLPNSPVRRRPNDGESSVSLDEEIQQPAGMFDGTCAICWAEFTTIDPPASKADSTGHGIVFGCGHASSFHLSCLQRLAQQDRPFHCPLCRTKFHFNSKCICGAELVKMSANDAGYDYTTDVNVGVTCNHCRTIIPVHEFVFHCQCPRGSSEMHPDGYDVCSTCAEETSNLRVLSDTPPNHSLCLLCEAACNSSDATGMCSACSTILSESSQTLNGTSVFDEDGIESWTSEEALHMVHETMPDDPKKSSHVQCPSSSIDEMARVANFYSMTAPSADLQRSDRDQLSTATEEELQHCADKHVSAAPREEMEQSCWHRSSPVSPRDLSQLPSQAVNLPTVDRRQHPMRPFHRVSTVSHGNPSTEEELQHCAGEHVSSTLREKSEQPYWHQSWVSTGDLQQQPSQPLPLLTTIRLQPAMRPFHRVLYAPHGNLSAEELQHCADEHVSTSRCENSEQSYGQQSSVSTSGLPQPPFQAVNLHTTNRLQHPMRPFHRALKAPPEHTLAEGELQNCVDEHVSTSPRGNCEHSSWQDTSISTTSFLQSSSQATRPFHRVSAASHEGLFIWQSNCQQPSASSMESSQLSSQALSLHTIVQRPMLPFRRKTANHN